MTDYCVVVKVVTHYQDGWDRSSKSEQIRCSGNTIAEANAKAKEVVEKYNGKESVGDFGIVLRSSTAEIVRTEKVSIV